MAVGMMLLRSIGGINGGNRVIRIDSTCNHGILVGGNLNLRNATAGMGGTGRGRRSVTRGGTITGSRTGVLTTRLAGIRIAMGIHVNRRNHMFNSIATGSVSSTTGTRCGMSVSGGGVRVGRPLGALNMRSMLIHIRPRVADAVGIGIMTRW